jgi:DNA-binding NarL/FixJ family response regulator
METDKNVSTVIIDCHLSTRELLARELSRESLCRVVGGAGSGMEALQVCEAQKPRLVILDLFVSGMSSIELMRELRRRDSQIRFLIYSGARSNSLLIDVLRESPHGLVRKQDSLQTLLDGVRAVCGGGLYHSKSAPQPPARPPICQRSMTLTERERDVLKLVAEGKRTKEIAFCLGISQKTAENHRANLMDKLGIHEVATLTRYAIRSGYIDLELFG